MLPLQFLWSLFQKGAQLSENGDDRLGSTIKDLGSDKYIRSISSYSSKSIFYFPLIIPDTCSPDEISLITRSLEQQYAIFVSACFSLIPFHKIPDNSVASIENYLNVFHQNIGIYSAGDVNALGNMINDLDETAIIEKAKDFVKKFYLKDLNESSYVIDRSLRHIKPLSEAGDTGNKVKKIKIEGDKTSMDNISGDKYTGNVTQNITKEAGPSRPESYETFDQRSGLFKDTDVKRYNEDVPLLINPKITFLVGKEERPIERNVLVGIKCYIHKYSAKVLMEDLYQSVVSKRKFLKFVKFVTGEERSLGDLLFGLNKIDYDVKSLYTNKNTSAIAMIKRRSRIRKMGVPYLTKTYTPNASFVITKNEVNMLREFYGLDIMKNNTIRTIMEDNFLLAFVIMDQEEEVANVYYESHNYGAQQISYTALERDKKESDRVMKQLYKDFSIRR